MSEEQFNKKINDGNWYRIEKIYAKNLELETLCDKYEEEHKTTFEYWKQLVKEDYKSKNEKAIKYIEKCRDYHKTYHNEDKMFADELTGLIMILQGEDNE